MRLYRVTYDGQSDFVEATSMSEAVQVWHRHVKAENGDDWDGTEEPEECALVSDAPVIRG